VIREALADSPLNHGKYLHSSEAKGHITVAQKIPGRLPPDSWQQHSYETQELYEALPAYGGLYDVYISQNTFYGPRVVSRLAQLSAMYSDLDFYKIPHLAEMHPRGVLELAMEDLERARIPRPSLAVATGRGLNLVWRHDSVPRAALPKWSLCQDHIFGALMGLGADPSARDAARVLRLVGSRNSKSGTTVEAIWEDLGEVIWGFSDLADEILPLSRDQLDERRERRRQEQREKLDSKGARRASEAREDVQKRFTQYSLALGRLSDLQLLLKLRGLDKLPPGHRDHWMFAAATSLAYLVGADMLERELIVLGKENAGWSEAEIRSRMSAVISRAHDASVGDKVVWHGQQTDPRYRLKNQTIIETLGVMPSEEAEMKVVISGETKRHRDRKRKERERRTRGVKPRDEYLAKAREKQALAKDLRRRQGMSFREIGKVLGISHTKARRLAIAEG
jgi:hypothetical protein